MVIRMQADAALCSKNYHQRWEIVKLVEKRKINVCVMGRERGD